MVLGVTGGIATGKTAVTEKFRMLGAAVLSADDVARDAVKPGTEVLSRLVKRFGGKILKADGSLDRDSLAERIFADENAREDLNRITHPAIGKLADQRLAELKSSGGLLVVYEAPLLFEAGAENRVDRTLVVTVDPELQLQRLMSRDSLTPREAADRIAAQMPMEEKIARADFVIDNSGTLEETFLQVEALFEKLIGNSSN